LDSCRITARITAAGTPVLRDAAPSALLQPSWAARSAHVALGGGVMLSVTGAGVQALSARKARKQTARNTPELN
jgi:hypothetical protein